MCPPAIPCETDTGNERFCWRRNVLTKNHQMLAISHSQPLCLGPKRPVPSLDWLWAVSQQPSWRKPPSCPRTCWGTRARARGCEKMLTPSGHAGDEHLCDWEHMVPFLLLFFLLVCHSAFSAPGPSPSARAVSPPWLPLPAVECSPSPALGAQVPPCHSEEGPRSPEPPREPVSALPTTVSGFMFLCLVGLQAPWDESTGAEGGGSWGRCFRRACRWSAVYGKDCFPERSPCSHRNARQCPAAFLGLAPTPPSWLQRHSSPKSLHSVLKTGSPPTLIFQNCVSYVRFLPCPCTFRNNWPIYRCIKYK